MCHHGGVSPEKGALDSAREEGEGRRKGWEEKGRGGGNEKEGGGRRGRDGGEREGRELKGRAFRRQQHQAKS